MVVGVVFRPVEEIFGRVGHVEVGAVVDRSHSLFPDASGPLGAVVLGTVHDGRVPRRHNPAEIHHENEEPDSTLIDAWASMPETSSQNV